MRDPEGELSSPFDRLAGQWDDDPARLHRAAAVASAIIQRTTAGGTWLDYGAGTGALGLALLGHADRVVLADSSEAMVAASRTKIATARLADRVRAVRVDLARGDELSERFDGVASLLALHHIGDAASLIGRLAGLLRPGGWLALADLDAEDGSFHGHPHDGGRGVSPAHHGFERAEVADWLAAAGLVEVRFSTPWREHKEGRDYPVFLAVGRLAA
ncbi:MAG: class I SAM-dependent methyltransferase [Brooklawnia sp.]|uniref:class I SAM-dependent DNA methyltransferase n=1 Tax=Brooklawnia sp. TaxID=2699740 RepID=UPI003C7948B8